MEIKGVASILCVMLVQIAYSQNKLEGHLLDYYSREPITFANIYCSDSGKGAISDIYGNFTLSLNVQDSALVQISCIGYETLEFCINRSVAKQTILLYPKQESIAEVSVIADEKKGLGTASLIKKDALKHLQPSSFADVLELLPGGVSRNNEMTTMKLISLREPAAAAGLNNQHYDYNSSFGTAFIIDGQPLSNDAELQNVTGSYSSEYRISRRNTTGKGIDMRLISTDNIESVEIIRGIPSVKYGDITSGVVNIKRNYKAMPLYGRVKSNPGSKLFSLGKGFLVDQNRSVNVDFDYLDYKSDPRNPKVNYSRITGSLRYGVKKQSETRNTDFSLNLDYTGSFDETISDPEIDLPETDKYHNAYNKLNIGSSYQWESKISLVKMVSASINTTYTHEKKTIDKSVSTSRDMVTTNRYEGEFYGEYLPTSYLARLVVDGKPFFAYADLSSRFGFKALGLKHDLLLGADFRYDKNFGDGEVYDERRPLYPGVGRPIASKDIPANQKLSFYIEEQINVSISKHHLKVRAGLRSAQALGVEDRYKISKKIYHDPRFNASWRLPYFKLLSSKDYIEITGGYGWHTKFPGLTHLYPNPIYNDMVQLNYYSQNEALRQVHYKTEKIDPTNYELAPNRNEKIELGFNMKLGQVRAYITAYREVLKGGFKQLGYYNIFDYKRYNNDSVDPSELSEAPTVDMFEYKNMKEFGYYNKRINGANEEKTGVEYQIDLGHIETLKSRLSINGAWMRVTYDLDEGRYKHPSVTIGNEDYPYIGYYTWDKGKEYEQFNTNFRADTHIKELGLMFSTAIQCMWYYQYKYNKHNGMPNEYVDFNGNRFPYTQADTEDPVLRFLYEYQDPAKFELDRTPIGIDVNLTVSKSISSNIDLSFYVNRILDYHPDYTQSNGNKVKRKVSPYFGMELNINL